MFRFNQKSSKGLNPKHYHECFVTVTEQGNYSTRESHFKHGLLFGLCSSPTVWLSQEHRIPLEGGQQDERATQSAPEAQRRPAAAKHRPE